jgi:hypothetical protein
MKKWAWSNKQLLFSVHALTTAKRINPYTRSVRMVSKYAQEGKNDQAIEQLKIFATQDNYKYGLLVFLEIDLLIKPLKNHLEFEQVMQKIKDCFWEN